MEILKVKDLSFKYPGQTMEAVRNVSFSLEKGEILCVCGETGSGKTSFLRMLKRELTPLGEGTGVIFFKEKSIDELSQAESACSIGFVMQRAEQQLVTDTVWHELAFGLENLGLSQNEIAGRVAEISTYLGIEEWYDKRVDCLSGGQKQLLNLASVMVMNPEVLILDEPTSELDPIASAEFVSTLRKLNRELMLTIIISEHRLEDIIPICDKLLVMEEGAVSFFGKPKQVIENLGRNHKLSSAMPVASRIFNELEGSGECPIDIIEGRRYIAGNYNTAVNEVTDKEYQNSKKKVLELKNVFFRYERNLSDVLCGVELTVYEGEVFCLLGGNGAGKSTTLGCIAGIRRFYEGRINLFDKKVSDYKNGSLYKNMVSMLPQDVQTVFLKNIVSEELEEVGFVSSEFPISLEGLMDKHPYDLSGGEQQLVALAKVLAGKPRILLLDEPTKGVDSGIKEIFVDIISKLKHEGVTVVMVSHDMEFAAKVADRCALMFRGEVVSVAETKAFFSNNNFYTTAARRLSRGIFVNTVTDEQIISLCLLNGRKES